MRLADPNDAERLEYLEHRLFPDNNLTAFSLTQEMKLGKCWVVERQKKIVGFLIARIVGSLIDILRVGVLPEHQGHGLGTKLVERALEETPEAMLTVRKDNVRALRLYQRLGFRIVGEVTSGVQPGWVMRR